MDADTKSGPSVARDFKLEKSLVGLAFDEIHLQALGARMKQLGAELGTTYFWVSVDSADGVERTSVNDPEAFRGPEIPEKIGLVFMHFGGMGERVNCNIVLRPSSADLKVEGKNAIEVRGLFIELKRELELRKYEFSWMAHTLRFQEGFKVRGLGLVVALLLLFYLPGYFVVWPWLDEAGNASIRALIGGGVALFSSCGALLTASQLQKAFPPVRFQGRFFDFSRRPRRVLYGIVMSVVVPLAVRILYDLRRH